MRKHGREKHTEFHQYNSKYDAFFCSKCDCWLESKCMEQNCKFCPERPEKPSQLKKVMVH